MKLAARTTRVGPSPTLQLTTTVKKMKADGIDVVNFAAGEPACDTPDFVKWAAQEAMDAGFTKYTPVTGIEELKEAIVEKFQRELGIHYERSQILVSCGAKHVLYNVFQALCESGDEVIIPTPYWVSYPAQVALSGAKAVFLQTEESSNYAIDPDALQACVSPRTKALILNSPCNPTGAIYDRKTLEAIAEVALRYDLVIVSDEIYEKMMYDGHQHLSIASLDPEVAKRTVVVNGVSKTFAMTGWRIGYAAGPQPLVKAMGHIQSQSTSNPTSISQKAAVAALKGPQDCIQQMVEDLNQQRQFMVKRLNDLPSVQCDLPAGAFYAFPNIKGFLGRHHAHGVIQSPSDLANFLLAEGNVACVPGEPFGSHVHLRLSYTPHLDVIKQGMDHFEEAIQRLV